MLQHFMLVLMATIHSDVTLFLLAAVLCCYTECYKIIIISYPHFFNSLQLEAKKIFRSKIGIT